MSGFEVVLPFDTDEPEFVRGFEAGRLWELLKHGGEINGTLDGQAFHSSNVEMVLRMLDAHDARMTAEFTDDPEWMILRRSEDVGC
jgi:hypothetical protein